MRFAPPFSLVAWQIRVYDDATKTLTQTLFGGSAGAVWLDFPPRCSCPADHEDCNSTPRDFARSLNGASCKESLSDPKILLPLRSDCPRTLAALAPRVRARRQGDTTGHSNRVFSLKFHPNDPNCIVTGGWDMTLQVTFEHDENTTTPRQEERQRRGARRVKGNPCCCWRESEGPAGGRFATSRCGCHSDNFPNVPYMPCDGCRTGAGQIHSV